MSRIAQSATANPSGRNAINLRAICSSRFFFCRKSVHFFKRDSLDCVLALYVSHACLRTEPIERKAVPDEAKRSITMAATLHGNYLLAAGLPGSVV